MEEMERALKALEREKKTYKRQNEYIRENYDRLSVTLPRGTKERISQTGETLNGFIRSAVLDRLEEFEKGGKR